MAPPNKIPSLLGRDTTREAALCLVDRNSTGQSRCSEATGTVKPNAPNLHRTLSHLMIVALAYFPEAKSHQTTIAFRYADSAQRLTLHRGHILSLRLSVFEW
jgi:hypothetical protein